MFELFNLFFFIAFFGIFGMILFTFIKGASQWNKNNHSPRLTVPAKVVAKRTNHQRHAGTQHHMAHTTTTYYVTFQVASGDRMELHLTGQEHGLLVEGDFGDLTFQGTRYLGFARKAGSFDSV